MLPEIYIVDETNAGTCWREAHCLLLGNLPLSLKSFNLLFLCKFVKSTMLCFPNSPIFSISAIYMYSILSLLWEYSTVYGLAPLMQNTIFVKTTPNGITIEIQLILKLHSSTIQTHQAYNYRWPSLLSQIAFCWSCQTIKVYCIQGCGASEWY